MPEIMSEQIDINLEQALSRAIIRYCAAEFATLARKVAHRLQRLSTSGIFGKSFEYKTLWDEYCHEIQNGPHDQLDYAWQSLIRPILDHIASQIPKEKAVLLSIGAAWEVGDHEPDYRSINLDSIRRSIERAVVKSAMNRDMSRFDPNITF